MKKTLLTLLPSVILTLSSCAIIAGDTKIQNIVDEDCHRGTLDKPYCDRDYDLVADLPLDRRDWINPNTIIFSYTPVEEPEVYAAVWKGFLSYLAKITGRKVVFLPVRSYAEQYAAMRAGHLHIAGVNTGGSQGILPGPRGAQTTRRQKVLCRNGRIQGGRNLSQSRPERRQDSIHHCRLPQGQ